MKQTHLKKAVLLYLFLIAIIFFMAAMASLFVRMPMVVGLVILMVALFGWCWWITGD